MRVVPGHTLSLRPVSAVVALLLLTASVVGAPARAGEGRDPVIYAGQALDGTGQPLGGTHALGLRYVDMAGAELWAETFASVAINDGSFAVELGAGAADQPPVGEKEGAR